MKTREERAPEQLEAHTKRSVNKPLSIAAIILLLFLISGLAFAAGLYLSKTPPPIQTPSPMIVEEGETEEEIPVINETQELIINWLDADAQEKREISPWLREAVYLEFNPFESRLITEDPDFRFDARKVGEVEGGRYHGFDLVLETYPIAGIGTSHQSFYLLIDPTGEKSPVLLDRYAIHISDIFTRASTSARATDSLNVDQLAVLPVGVLIDAGATIAEFEETPSLVTDDAGRRYWYLGEWNHLAFPEVFDGSASRAIGKLGDGRTLYQFTAKEDVFYGLVFETLFYAIRADGRMQWFDLEVPFFNVQNPLEGTTSGRPFVNWSDGSGTNTDMYFKGEIGGCGFASGNHIMERSEVGTIVPVATYRISPTQTGTLYGPERYDSGRAKELLDSWLSWNQEGTLEEFEALHPVFYYTDVYGRIIEFQHESVLPPMECGKPVIYLYPEQEMDIRVEVAPRGGFSYTDPDYGDGWEVKAKPNGELENKADGKIYPYLFWEGRGALYTEPERYFVVSKSEVESFLDEKLASFGFVAHEIADFKEFWLPRMQAAPYYKIGFHGKEVMDAIAPLTLSEKPDTVIRVLMDFAELQKPIPEHAPFIGKTPERKGFVVTEWGGVIR